MAAPPAPALMAAHPAAHRRIHHPPRPKSSSSTSSSPSHHAPASRWERGDRPLTVKDGGSRGQPGGRRGRDRPRRCGNGEDGLSALIREPGTGCPGGMSLPGPTGGGRRWLPAPPRGLRPDGLGTGRDGAPPGGGSWPVRDRSCCHRTTRCSGENSKSRFEYSIVSMDRYLEHYKDRLFLTDRGLAPTDLTALLTQRALGGP